MRDPKSVLENETHKLLRDFEIQIDHKISVRRPDLIIINKKKKKRKKKKKKRTCKIVDFAVSDDHRVKLKESLKKDKYLDLTWEWKKLWNIKGIIIPLIHHMNCNWCSWYSHQRWVKTSEDLKIRRLPEIIQTTATLRSARILRGVLETVGDFL